MRTSWQGIVCAALTAVAATGVGSEPLPQWAYPVNPPGLQPAPDDGVPRRVPGSSAAFTLTQIRDLFKAPDQLAVERIKHRLHLRVGVGGGYVDA